ncbi:hypothetical protein [Sphingosinicella sp. CPCC 101087]|uniref:hypothetical protein n=1 Tax=Sphingosinicella sp. CPCC 101087 TaxID=2497754 RepID=UPI001FB0FAC0|nr:hypothetical protein [Sphingosinicella sp. CPCC 101087]
MGEGVAHESFLRYRRFYWLKVALGIFLLTWLVYLVVDVQPRHNGGSWLGYTLGTLGAALIVWLAMLGIRKRAITRGRWSLKAWTSAHVYLGLALIAIGSFHTGFQFGWNVHTAAYVLMMLVILSGIYGVSVYSVLPQGLSDARSEMTGPQMIDAVNSLDKQIQAAAQPLSDADSEVVLGSLGEDPFGGGVWRRLTGSYPRCGNRRALQVMRGRLTEVSGRQAEAIEQVVGLLERKAAALQRVRGYVQRRAMLEIWLFVHIPLTFVLIVALLAHIISVFFYW